MKKILSIIVFFVIPLNAATRSVQIQLEPEKESSQIVYIPVPLDFFNTAHMQPVQSPFGPSAQVQTGPIQHNATNTNQQQPQAQHPNWFFYLMRLLCNFGKIFVDVHNRPKLKENISDFLDNVGTMAQELSTSRSCSKKQRELAILRIMQQLEILSAQLPAPIIQ